MKFKKGDIVYCIDNIVYSIMEEEMVPSRELNFDTPYEVENPNGGGNDLKLKAIEYYYRWQRFISAEEFNIKNSLKIL